MLGTELSSAPDAGPSTESFKFNLQARDAFRFEIPPDLVSVAVHILSPAHEEFLRFAVASRPNGIRGSNHDPAVLEYLRQELGINIPDPDRDHFQEAEQPATDSRLTEDLSRCRSGSDRLSRQRSWPLISVSSKTSRNMFGRLQGSGKEQTCGKTAAPGRAAAQFDKFVNQVEAGDQVLAYSDNQVLDSEPLPPITLAEVTDTGVQMARLRAGVCKNIARASHASKATNNL